MTRHDRLGRTIGLSSIMGALKVGAQTLVAFIMYPVIIRIGGVETLGSWVVIQLVIGYGGLVTVGIGTALARETAYSTDPNDLSFRHILSPAFTCAVGIAVVLAALISLFGTPFLAIVGRGLPEPIAPLVLWTVLLAVLLRLVASLYGSLLTGLHQNYITQFAQLVQVLIYLATFFAILGHTSIMVALATAYAASYFVEGLITFVALSRSCPTALRALPSVQLTAMHRFWRIVRPYFFLDLALLGREPAIKSALYICCGPGTVGMFELASRVPAAARQAFVLGLTSLMPAVVHLQRTERRTEIIRMGRGALRYLIWTAAGVLFVYALNAQSILTIWLGDTTPDLVAATQVLAWWWLVATLNVPAWWVGIGAGTVRSNTRIVSTHLAASVLLFPLAAVLPFSGVALIILWVAFGVAMQLLLYGVLQRKTGLIRPIYWSPSVAKSVAAFIVAAGLAVAFHRSMVRQQSLLNALVTSTSAYTLCISAFALLGRLATKTAMRHEP